MTIDNLCQKYATLDERGKDLIDCLIHTLMRHTLKGRILLSYEQTLKQHIQNNGKGGLQDGQTM